MHLSEMPPKLSAVDEEKLANLMSQYSTYEISKYHNKIISDMRTRIMQDIPWVSATRDGQPTVAKQMRTPTLTTMRATEWRSFTTELSITPMT